MPLKREPDAVSSLPLGRMEGETVVSNGCQLGSKPRPGSYSSALLKEPLLFSPPATSTLPESNSVAGRTSRAVLRLPVLLQVPKAGSYSSALLKEPLLSCPPATCTLPDGNSVAVCALRAVLRLPVLLQVP